MKNIKLIPKYLELDDHGEVSFVGGTVISKDKIVDLDNLCYQQILIDLDIEVM